MLYWPNPAHKRETTEAGPPAWRPDKAPCPRLTVEERDALLEASIALNPQDPMSRRYAFRRSPLGEPDFFEAKLTEVRESKPVFHGYPTVRVPSRILRLFRDQGAISNAEYRRMIKELG